MNLPNKLSLMRVIMVPLFVAVMVLPESILPDTWSRILSAAIFILTAFTDFLDGMIARKFNMITGKLMDPLADKCMVFGAMLAILYKYDYLRNVFIWAALIVIFRELAITSMRLIISSSAGKVVAAAWLGKVKTVTQIICIVVVLLEPVIIPQSSALYDMHLFSYITIAAMTVMTLWSGIDYMKTYWQFLDPTK